MALKDGMAALNLEMTDRVPRTEYGPSDNWPLVRAVTGIDVTPESDPETKRKASAAMERAWNYDFRWNVWVGAGNGHFPGRYTKMGHAVFADGGTDYSEEVICPFESPEEVLAFDPMEEYGPVDIAKLTKEFNSHYADSVAFNPDAVNMTGIYTTCVSGLLEMFGWDMLLMAAGTDPEAFGEVTNRYCKWIGRHFEALAQCDAPVVMIHDDIVWTSGAFIHPDWYKKYVFANYKKLFAPLLEAGKKIMYTSDGTYTQFVDDIAGCGVHGFVMEPTTDMGYIAEKYGKTHCFIGNADTRILLKGSKEDIYNEVKRCMDIGKKYPGFFMAVGNHIPPNTPVENAIYYNECYEKLGKR